MSVSGTILTVLRIRFTHLESVKRLSKSSSINAVELHVEPVLEADRAGDRPLCLETCLVVVVVSPPTPLRTLSATMIRISALRSVEALRERKSVLPALRHRFGGEAEPPASHHGERDAPSSTKNYT